MPIKAYTSASLKDLVKKLSEDTKTTNRSVFQPDYLVTPNNGLKKWLKVEIAQQNGIAANIQFLRMNQIASIIYKIVGGKEENKEQLSELQLQWLLFHLIDEKEFKTKFPLIADYSGNESQKRFALAGKLASLFNKYQTFIPEKITDWEHTIDTSYENEAWQAYLWSKLKSTIKDSFYTDSDCYAFINKKLKDTSAVEELIKKLPAISVFNLNDLSPANIDLLLKLSEFIQVTIYFFSPLTKLDFENISNSLLKNWIGSQKTTIEHLLSKKIDVLSLNSASERASSTLLNKLQQDLKNNTDHLTFTAADLKDESLVINSCYTANREVEVLYNYLVKMVTGDSQNAIGAKDIAVFCPDISKYSSSIKAVFDTAPYPFPYHLLDDAASDTASPLRALATLFSIDTRWFKPENVMHLLEYPSVRNKFEIKDVAKLRELVNAANIRNGYTGEKTNETHLISWEHGLKRLMLGLCLSGEEQFQQNDEWYLTIDETEGSAGYDLIRLRFFIKTLKEQLENLAESKTLAEWVEFTRNSIDLFLATDKDPRLQELDKELSNLLLLSDKVSEAIPFNAFFASLKNILDGISNESRGLKSGITFCSTLPSRSVPFKIIALLGINYDTFPRRRTNLSFDLLLTTEASKMQDPKEKDKFFFLETLLAAENHLYLSFIGKDAKNNKERPPSSLIDEITDYIRLRYTGDKKTFSLITEHPLHSFDSKYFDAALPEFYTYLGTNNHATPTAFFRQPEPSENDTATVEVPFFKFINFIKDPFKYYYNNTLGIYYKDEEERLSAEELFDLDTLQAWAIKGALIRSQDLIRSDESRLEAVEKGELPLASLGRVLLEEINQKTISAHDRFLAETNNREEEECELTVPIIAGIHLKGTIKNIYGNKFIFNNVSTGDTKSKIAAFLECLLVNESGKDADLYYNSVNGEDFIIIKSPEFNTPETKELLNRLIALLARGFKEIVPLYPDLSSSLAELLAEPAAREQIINKALAEKKYLSEYLSIEWKADFFVNTKNQDELVTNLELINTVILSKFN